MVWAALAPPSPSTLYQAASPRLYWQTRRLEEMFFRPLKCSPPTTITMLSLNAVMLWYLSYQSHRVGVWLVSCIYTWSSYVIYPPPVGKSYHHHHLIKLSLLNLIVIFPTLEGSPCT